MLEFDERPRRRLRSKPLMFLALAILATSSVFAASTSLTRGTPIEFGQGVFQVRVCDTWIGINPISGSGAQYVNQLQIIGLDSVACSGTNVMFQIFQNGNSSPLALFVGQGASRTVNATNLVLAINTSYSANRALQARLINPAGTLTRNDGYERISAEYNTSGYFDGNYDVVFSNPLALSSAVNTITVQSTAQ